MKMVFLLPPEQVTKLLSDNQTALTPDDINGLFLNIKYQDGAVSVVTGTSIKVFSLDKTLEHSFDAFAKDFLFSHGMDFEEVWTRQFMIFLELAQMHWFCGLPLFLLALKMNEC